MKRFSFLLTLVALALPALSQYQANWESLNTRKIPAWFHQDKFGIFIHWGTYAVPAYAPVVPNSGISYSEWYWFQLTQKQKDFQSFHDKTYGKNFSYHQFESLFKAELYDPEHWAKVFRQSGARYVVLTSKHHEGYCLWNSAEADRSWGRPWNAVTGTPKRDLLGDLTNAVRKEGLKMGYYYSLYEWFNPLWKIDKNLYVDQHMIPQFKDLVTKYKPSIIFSDGEWDISDTAWRSAEILAWLYNESPVAKEVVVNDRWGKSTRGQNTASTYTTSEYGAGMSADVIWEESRGIGHSYGYNRNEKLSDYKSSRDLILILADVVARGGNLLLDIGPTADGRIPVIMEQRLIEIGDWLKVNGESIFNTTAYREPYQWSPGERPKKDGKSYMAGYDVAELVSPKNKVARIEHFFTRKGKDLYCIVPNASRELRLRNFKAPGKLATSVLGSAKRFTAKQVGSDLVIDLSQLVPGELKHEIIVVKLEGGL